MRRAWGDRRTPWALRRRKRLEHLVGGEGSGEVLHVRSGASRLGVQGAQRGGQQRLAHLGRQRAEELRDLMEGHVLVAARARA